MSAFCVLFGSIWNTLPHNFLCKGNYVAALFLCICLAPVLLCCPVTWLPAYSALA